MAAATNDSACICFMTVLKDGDKSFSRMRAPSLCRAMRAATSFFEPDVAISRVDAACFSAHTGTPPNSASRRAADMVVAAVGFRVFSVQCFLFSIQTRLDMPSLASMPIELLEQIVPVEDRLPFALASRSMPTLCINDTESRWITRATSTMSRVKWAVEVMGATPTVKWCAAAARRGEGRTVVYISWTYNVPLDGTVCDAAAAGGRVEVLRYLHFYVNAPWEKTVYFYAARHGHLRMLQWLYEVKAPFANGEVEDNGESYLGNFPAWHPSEGAVDGGHLHILEWMRSAGHEIYHTYQDSKSTMSVAVASGHIHVVRWLHQHMPPWMSGSSWEEETAVEALCRASHSYGSSYDMLEWVLGEGIRIDAELWYFLGVRGGIALARWLVQHGASFRWGRSKPSVYVAAMQEYHDEVEALGVIQWIYANGCRPSPDAIEYASFCAWQHVLEWLATTTPSMQAP